MDGLHISLLGPGRIELDGQALTRLLAPKHQALLFVLAAEGLAWPRHRLAALLWGELDEAAARGNLRGALSRLRRWLPAALAVDAREVGFAATAPLRVDLHALRRAQDASLPHAERVAAAEAWRGPLLEGFDIGGADGFEQWLAGQRQRAARDVVALRRDLRARAEHDGAVEQAIGHARALLDVDDADEEAHMALMRLLAADGRRSAAIAQYETCRAALAQRLGARPSAACYALYTQIHADRGGLCAAPAPAPHPAPPVAPAVPAGPAAGTPLIGRDDELALIAERLADPACRWLTLVGPGGVGKTRLALAAAQARAGAYRHGLLVLSGRDHAEGGALSDAQTLLQQVLARVGSDRVEPGALLLVLDNLETVPAAARFEPLLRERAPGAVVLATSRVRVGGGREWLLELGGLSLARAAPGQPASSAAAALLQAAARRLVPRFSVAAEADAVERVCALVGGLPLALEMAARGVHAAGVAAVADRIAAGAALADDDRPADDRHHSLDTVLRDSWALLPAAARDAASRLAQLPGAFDAALAEAAGVAGDPLAVLREHAWLTWADGPAAPGWLAMHPLQQAWLRRRAEPALPAAVMRALHAALAGCLPRVAPFDDLAPGATVAPLAHSAAASAPLLAAATRQACAHGDIESLAHWIDGATALLQHRGRQAEAAALITEALDRPDLPRWRCAGWRLRRAELLDGNGEASAAQRERRTGLVALGLPDVAADGAGWSSLLGASVRLRRHEGWPAPGAERQAFGALLVRSCIFNANTLSFLPDPGPMLRAGVLADAACRAAGAPAALPRIVAAWGSASLGHPWLARRLRRRAPPAKELPPRSAALLDSGHAALQLASGEWAGLAGALDGVAACWQRLGAGRQEMEVRSLGAKLAFYEGRLAQAWERFAQMSELAMQRPGESWRAWGPLGQCEVGLCLAPAGDALLQRLLERSTQLLSEMENVDAAYVLRRHGAAARLAWRRGDATEALLAARTGAATAARTRLFGFWAHEGLAGLGDVLVGLRAAGTPLPALERAWSDLASALDAHARRFRLGVALRWRLQGAWAAANGRAAGGHRLLRRAALLSEHLAAHVELARTLEALAAAAPEPATAARAAQLWSQMRGGAGEAGSRTTAAGSFGAPA